MLSALAQWLLAPRCASVPTSPHAVLCVQTVADACRTGASTNIIFGLALGYQSCIIPTIVLAVVIFVSFSLANMYGIACAALGMLGTLATGAPSFAAPAMPSGAFGHARSLVG